MFSCPFGPNRVVLVASLIFLPQARALAETQIVARGGSGVGVFQDIQVPINELSNMRGDGKVGGEENADHLGFPLYAGLGVSRQVGRARIDALTFEALQMRAATGPAETQSASYSRLEAKSGVSYSLPVGQGWSMILGLDASLRRSSFNNISSSHYIESALVGGGLGLESGSLSLAAFARMAPMARFGYSESTVLGGRPFADSKATVSEVGGTAAFALAPRVYLDTGLAYERASVSVADVSKYSDFGLAVQDTAQPSRAYELATTVVRVGIRKEF